MKSRLREFVIALSFANLFFFGVWRQLQDPAESYFRATAPTLFYEGVLVATVVLLAAALWSCYQLLRWRAPEWLRTAVLCGAPLLGFLLLAHGRVALIRTWSPNGFWAALLVASGLYLVAFYLARRLILGAARALLLILAPVLPVCCVASIWNTARVSGEFSAGTHSPALGTAAGAPASRRIVWMLFDELDQDLAFSMRPPELSLPELDRLRAGSFYAANALQAGPETLVSIPALTLGREITASRPAGPTDLRITFKDTGVTTSWKSEPTIFSEASRMGWRVAGVGWCHPYDRLFGESAEEFHWRPIVWATPILLAEHYARKHGALQGIADLVGHRTGEVLGNLLGLTSGSGHTPGEQQEEQDEQVEDYLSIRACALKLVADPRIDFVFIHWPIPHPPGIFDRIHGTLERHERGYLGNLVLTDRTLGEVRQAMEKSGLWDRTAILLSSDHALRPWDQEFVWSAEERLAVSRTTRKHVPFMLKLPGQRCGVSYDAPLRTILTRDLLTMLMKREADINAEQLARWVSTWHSCAERPEAPNNSRSVARPFTTD